MAKARVDVKTEGFRGTWIIGAEEQRLRRRGRARRIFVAVVEERKLAVAVNRRASYPAARAAASILE